MGDKVISEKVVGTHTVNGREIDIVQSVWRDAAGFSFDVVATDNGELLTTKESFDEYPSEEQIRQIVMKAAGPRWRVMRGDELIGRAEQMNNERNVLNLENPRSVADWKYTAMGSEWSQTASTELREVEPGIRAVWAVREPYTHGQVQGYKHEDTGIRIVDAWLHGQ